MRYSISALFAALALLTGCVSAPGPRGSIPAHGVIGVSDAHLQPEYWIERSQRPRQLVLDDAAIVEQNDRLRRLDKSTYDIEQLGAALSSDQVRAWVNALSQRPTQPLFDEHGRAVEPAALDELVSNAAIETISPTQPTRYGLVVRRADLRTFPTRLRVFGTQGDTDIDRFQENALFPGTPVAVVHESRDGKWWFIVSPLYAAWIEKEFVATAPAEQVFGFGRKQPYLIVTGASARTVYTPEEPGVSELQLDMGVRAPLLHDWPADRPVNGQHPYAAYVVELPVRAADGSLRFAPALLPRTADVTTDYLPLTRENLLRQSFKFLGERYGWGHSYNARDCSGFVSEVYRSFGVQMPRNTGDQGVSPAFDRIAFTGSDTREARLAVLRELQVGDLIYIPRHVMMVIGHDRGMPYVIHDTTGITYRDDQGSLTRVHLNGVAVTPLTPLLLGPEQPMVDRIYSIQRIRQRAL